MSKPPPRTITCEDYTVTQDGVEYHPHEGEFVRFVGRPSPKDVETFWAFDELADKSDEPERPADDAADEEKLAYLAAHVLWRKQRNEELDASMRIICAVLAQHIVGWNLTNDQSQPIVPFNATVPAGEPFAGQPYAELTGDVEVIVGLDAELIYFLRTVFMRNETKAERKNESSGSETGAPVKGRSRTARG